MTWFRVDDKFGEHPKVRAIPRAHRRNAIGLWTLAGVWCASNVETTDGRNGNVPGYMLDELCSEQSDAEQLVRVGLWHAAGHDCAACPQPLDPDGYVFHEWETKQPTAEQIAEKRQGDTERKQRSRERARLSREGHTVTPAESARVHSPRPEPVPNPSPYVDGDLGGDRYVTLRAVPAESPPRCSAHRSLPADEDPPCHGCRRARIAAEQAEQAERDRRANARATCDLCHGTGLIEDDNGDPIRKCTHGERTTA